jgi:hypothetical protein
MPLESSFPPLHIPDTDIWDFVFDRDDEDLQSKKGASDFDVLQSDLRYTLLMLSAQFFSQVTMARSFIRLHT